MNRHVYEPLSSDEHIRIIILHPSEDQSSPLTCSIQQLKLDDNVKDYECISYAWGEPIFSHRLDCDDGSTFEITASLHSALKRFRSKRRSRHLWADAVCINQPDVHEKSRQIPLMARIFHGASRVLVWLGHAENEEQDAISWLSRLTRISSIIHEESGDSKFLKSRLDGLVAAHWPRIVRLLDLPWFSRRWIVQEVALNADVCLYCGTSKISWPRFILAVEILAKWLDSVAVSGYPLKALLKLGYLWRTWCLLDDDPKECGLLDLLDAFSHFKCAMDNDKVYALAGLATDVRTNLGQSAVPSMTITIDYAMPTEAVFRMVALQRMMSGRVFSTLADASARRLASSTRSSHRLPSWVPDLGVERHHRAIIYDSPGSSPPAVAFVESDMSLHLSGAIRDLIFNDDAPLKAGAISCRKLGPRIPQMGGSKELFFSWLRECWKMLVAERLVRYHRMGHPIDQHIVEALCQVITGQGGHKQCFINQRFNGRISTPGDLAAQSAVYQNTIVLGCELLKAMDSFGEDQDHERFVPFIDLALATLTGRRLFLGAVGSLVASNSGELTYLPYVWGQNSSVLCIGPEDLEQEDIGVVFDGADYPLFLRPVDSGRYRLLGDGSYMMLATDFYPSIISRQFGNEESEVKIVLV
jgi:hypothetical protein